MKHIDLFSGIGGFALGLQQAGFNFTGHHYSEIDKHAIANYKYNFKNSTYAGPVESIQPISGAKTIVTFGSPCQDFSLAGKRKGMEGERSSLIRQAIAFIEKQQPSVFIWENVKGAFSSNSGADFWAIIQAFANLRGYRLEWQLLNTSWLLPQNRERIYLVGHLAGESAANVFPFKESDFRITQRQSKAAIVRAITAGGNSGGHHSGMTLVKSLTGKDFTNTIRGGGRGSLTEKHNWDLVKIIQRGHGYLKTNIRDIAPTIHGNDYPNNHPIVKPVLTPDRAKKRQNGRRFKEKDEPSFTLTSQDKHGVQVNNQIRRLTEVECERLQGFPDDWTKYGIYEKGKKEISKTQRYKLCGNSVSVPIVKMIGERLIKGLTI